MPGPAVPTADDPGQPLVVSATRAAWLATHGSHPNVVRILGVHHLATGPRLMIEHVAARDLAALIDAAYPARIGLGEALAIARDVARGLHFLHELRNEKGVAVRLIHGTLSPALVQIGYDGIARVGGLERLAATRGAPRPLPEYAAPEQSMPGAAVDRRADVFALAAVLLRAATGLKQHHGVLPLLGHEAMPHVPASVEDVLRRALSPEPAKRHASCEELRAAIEGCVVREGLHVGADHVAIMLARFLPEHLPNVAPAPPPRPDQSLWLPTGDPGAAPRWMAVESVLDATPAATASGFDVVSVAVPRNTLPPGTQSPLRPSPLVPATTPVAPTMSLDALTDAQAAAPPKPSPKPSQKPNPFAGAQRPPGVPDPNVAPQQPAAPQQPQQPAPPPQQHAAPPPQQHAAPPQQPADPGVTFDELGNPRPNPKANPFDKSSLYSIPKSIAGMKPRSSPNPFPVPNPSPSPSPSPYPFPSPNPNPNPNPSPNPHPSQYGMQAPHPSQYGMQPPHPSQYGMQAPHPSQYGMQPPHPSLYGMQAPPHAGPDLPLHLSMPAGAAMISPGHVPGHHPPPGADFPLATDAVRLPDEPERRRLITDPVFLLGFFLVLFFAALVIAYLVSA